MTVNGRLTVFYDKCENVNKSIRYSIPYLTLLYGTGVLLSNTEALVGPVQYSVAS